MDRFFSHDRHALNFTGPSYIVTQQRRRTTAVKSGQLNAASDTDMRINGNTTLQISARLVIPHNRPLHHARCNDAPGVNQNFLAGDKLPYLVNPAITYPYLLSSSTHACAYAG